jgi:YVTN family beta-propeller protein
MLYQGKCVVKLLIAPYPSALKRRHVCRMSVLLLLLVLVGACEAPLSRVKPPLLDEGEVLLYVQPFPEEAGRLRFEFEEISAVRTDGTEIPFALSLAAIKGREMTRQRLLGEARLPEGTYSGLSVKVKDAFLKVEEGEAALLVPPTATRMEFPFTVTRKRGLVLTLTFRALESWRSGYSFTPAFSILVPPRPLTDLAGYVTNYGDNSITVFDKKVGQVVGLITSDGPAAGMVIDRRGGKAYIALPGADTIEVLDIFSGDVTNKLRLNTGDRPKEIALTSDGRTLVTANSRSNTASIIDTGSLLESGRVVVGNGPGAVLVDPTGRRAFIFNRMSSTISVIDVPGRSLLATIATDQGPLRGQFNKRGDRFYVIHEWSAYVSVVDAGSLAVVRRLQVGMGMVSIKVDPNTDLVYMGRRNDPRVGIYEPQSFVPLDYIRADGSVTHLTIDNDNNNLIMVEGDSKRVLMANLISKKIVGAMDVGEGPYWASVAGER